MKCHLNCSLHEQALDTADVQSQLSDSNLQLYQERNDNIIHFGDRVKNKNDPCALSKDGQEVAVFQNCTLKK